MTNEGIGLWTGLAIIFGYFVIVSVIGKFVLDFLEYPRNTEQWLRKQRYLRMKWDQKQQQKDHNEMGTRQERRQESKNA